MVEKKVLMITHTDLDGLASALLYERYNTNDQYEIIFEEPEKITERSESLHLEIFEKYFDEIVFLDLPGIKGYKNIDHHVKNHTGKENITPCVCDWEGQGVYVKESPSAARLVYELFGKDDREIEWFINEVDKIDSANVMKEDLKINSKGLYNNDLFNFANVISQHRESKDLIYYFYYLKHYLETKELPHSIVEQARQNIKEKYDYFNSVKKEILDIGKYKVGKYYLDENYNKFDKWLPSVEDDVDLMFSIKQPINAMTVGWNIFRKEECPIHIGELCNKFGGGGHKTIGGCRYSEDIIKEFLKEVEN